jgi:hypothetical protein
MYTKHSNNWFGQFHPTSMTFDSDDNIWLQTTTSDLVIMDKKTGQWQYKYGKTAIIPILIEKIDDLATFRATCPSVPIPMVMGFKTKMMPFHWILMLLNCLLK